MVVQEPVQAAIWQCLNHYAFSDATFLAERLYAEVNTDEALFILATCYYRCGKPARAYALLKAKGYPTPACRFLFAQCCVDINRLSEAEAALTGNVLLKAKSPEDLAQELGELAPFALRLLGKIYSKTDRCAKASDSYKRSLKLNPFMWSSFESLCKSGDKPDPVKIFQTPSTQQLSTLCHSPYPTPPTTAYSPAEPLQEHNSTPLLDSQQQETSPNNPTPPNLQTPQIQLTAHTPENIMDVSLDNNSLQPPPAPKFTQKSSRQPRLERSIFANVNPMPTLSPLTPSFGVFPLEATPSPGANPNNFTPPVTTTPILNIYDSIMLADSKVQAKKPVTRRQGKAAPPKPPVFSQSGNTNTNTIKDAQTPSPTQSNIPSLRRSSRLNLWSASSSSVKENNNKAQSPKFTSPKAPVKKSRAKSNKSTKSAQDLNEINKEKTEQSSETKTSTVTMQIHMATMQKQSADGLMALLQEMGRAHLALAQFECDKAIQMFTSLPPRHYNTGWVLAQVGRAYFEMDHYKKADKIFEELRQLEPYHLEGVELYSTTLWHLQKEVQLSALAQEMTELDKNCPETWIVTGNCFSLQKEHDVAIKFFQRAVQIDPDFRYAYSLLGHEYVATEELDKAMACYRNAIRIDPWHYNAWYGIGQIYYKQEKFALAEVHFRKALSINPKNSTLLAFVAVTQHALKKSDQALATLNRAIATNPSNALAKFHKASILFATERLKEALAELEVLKEIVPTESLVYFLIGKVHKKLGNTHLALSNFSWAMDLDPKGANNQIKEAIDKRYVTDDEEAAGGLEDGILDDPIEGSSNNSSLMEDMQLQAIESDESL